MVLYYSATGNSAYVAKRIAEHIGDGAVDLFERLREHDHSSMTSQRPWVLVVPTYAWQIPHMVRNWFQLTPLKGNQEIYFVLTCGDSIADAGRHAAQLCEKKGMTYKGCAEIVMPENYIALFRAPDPEQAKAIVTAAQPAIDRTANLIAAEAPLAEPAPKITDKISSGIVNRVFYSRIISAKKFFVTDKCVGCGHCVQVCPMKNIMLIKNKPMWSKNCTHCMACICTCPTAAIEYGKGTAKKVRYTCPEI